ncbi:MAG: HAMP domain-containing sensor histidine kinase [Tistlia sp.]|uniref:sensor histidine kinase n=1 Tax=Tistlia sp. TaxID=3057121 RepID=UPI0034A1DEF7
MSAARRWWRGASFRFAVLYALLFATSMAALGGFVYWSSVDVIERQVGDTVQAELRGLAEQYAERGLPRLLEVIEQRSAPGGDTDNVYLLVAPSGQHLAGNLRSWPEAAQPDGEWLRLRLFRTLEHTEPVTVGARAFELRGGFRLLVGRDMGARESLRRTILEAIGWGLGAALLLGAFGGWLLGRYLLSRVETVSRISRRIVDGDLSQRVPLSGTGDAFDRLAENLNRMLARIETLMTGMRVVTDSLAHDLRSPLTRLRSRIEMALREQEALHPDGSGTGQEAADRQVLEQALAEVETIRGTFDSLIAIAEAEAGLTRVAFDRVDLAELVAELAELYEPLAEESHCRLRVALDGPAAVPGHRQLLAQALSNLLDNALKYGCQGGEIAIALERTGGEALLSVSDRGPGIPAAAREEVLKRFVRLDESRSLPGSGLGLSLAAAVATLHDSRLELQDNAPGLKVVWRFALAADG